MKKSGIYSWFFFVKFKFSAKRKALRPWNCVPNSKKALLISLREKGEGSISVIFDFILLCISVIFDFLTRKKAGFQICFLSPKNKMELKTERKEKKRYHASFFPTSQRKPRNQLCKELSSSILSAKRKALRPWNCVPNSKKALLT